MRLRFLTPSKVVQWSSPLPDLPYKDAALEEDRGVSPSMLGY